MIRTQVDDHIWIGDAASVTDLPADITAILNMTGTADLVPPHVAYLQLNQADGAPIPIDKISRALAFLRAQIDVGHNVLVHCKHGVSRSAAIIVAFWMDVHRWSWDHAVRVLRAKAPEVNPKPQLEESVEAYFNVGKT